MRLEKCQSCHPGKVEDSVKANKEDPGLTNGIIQCHFVILFSIGTTFTNITSVHEATVNHHARQNAQENKVAHEVLVIPDPDAVVDPRTMMVELRHTPITERLENYTNTRQESSMIH